MCRPSSGIAMAPHSAAFRRTKGVTTKAMRNDIVKSVTYDRMLVVGCRLTVVGCRSVVGCRLTVLGYTSVVCPTLRHPVTDNRLERIEIVFGQTRAQEIRFDVRCAVSAQSLAELPIALQPIDGCNQRFDLLRLNAHAGLRAL